MNWEALVDLLRRNPVITIVIVTASLSAGISTGGYLWHAEAAHAQTAKNEKTIEQLIEFQRQLVKEKEIDLAEKKAAEQAARQERIKLCMAGRLPDADLCAEVGVFLR